MDRDSIVHLPRQVYQLAINIGESRETLMERATVRQKGANQSPSELPNQNHLQIHSVERSEPSQRNGSTPKNYAMVLLTHR